MNRFHVWVFKINTRRGWEFDQYFRSRAVKPVPMASGGWIRSASSLRYLREDVKRGDVFLCYEANRKRLVGLARAASDGRDIGERSLLDFCSPGEAIRLRSPLKRKPDLDHVLAFTPQHGRGTIQPIAPDEFRVILTRILGANPSQKDQLKRFVHW